MVVFWCGYIGVGGFTMVEVLTNPRLSIYLKKDEKNE